MPQEIEVRSGLSPAEFISSYVKPCRPVVIEKALDDWPALKTWTPAYFKQRFGSLRMPLQGRGFNMVQTQTIADYVDSLPSYESRSSLVTGSIPYLRYSHQAGDDFQGQCFAMLREEWKAPPHLPKGGFFYPWTGMLDGDPTRTRFPDFGIYISPRCAVTALHEDAFGTNACLHQLYGEKRCYLYPKGNEKVLLAAMKRPRETIDIDAVPVFDGIEPIQTVLKPGQVLFIPKGWFHEVYTITASVSLTFNFVHLGDAASWVAERIRRNPVELLPMSLFWTVPVSTLNAAARLLMHKGDAPAALEQSSRQP